MPDKNVEETSKIEQEIEQVLGERSTASDHDAKTITLLLKKIREGDEDGSAENELFELVMDDCNVELNRLYGNTLGSNGRWMPGS